MTHPPAHPVPSLAEFLWPRPKTESRSLLANQRLSLTFNARGALHEVGHELLQDSASRQEILIPGFHCPSGVTPLLEAGMRAIYYRVRPDLSIDWNDLLGKVGSHTRAVLVIHFFGFETDLSALQALRDHGIAVVEDWSHSFLRWAPLSLPRPQGDYQVFSFWKLAPTGVGGGLLRLGPPVDPPRKRGNTSWSESMVRGKRELEELLEHSPHQRLNNAFQRLEHWRLGKGIESSSEVPSEPPAVLEASRGEDHYPFHQHLARAAMPAQVRRRLLATDFSALALRRRQNYMRLAQGLPRVDQFEPLRPQLDPHCCPWVFPVRLIDRDRIDRGWRQQGVALHTFGIWLHSGLQRADRPTREDAQQMARELLCLSIHQGLREQDLATTLTVIGQHFGTS